MTLPDKSLAFARSIGEQWQDQATMDLPSFQRRFLYVQAFGAAHTAKSYWILHQAGRFNDCNILARNLLERIFNSRVAKKSARHAVELIAHELSERIRRLGLLHAEHQPLPQQAIDTITSLERELLAFQSLLGSQSVAQWDFYRRAVEAGIASWAYRGLYSEFSCFAHAGYEVSRPQELDSPSPFADFIALLAPIDTAIWLHDLSCTQKSCEIGSNYNALYQEFRRETIGDSMSEDG